MAGILATWVAQLSDGPIARLLLAIGAAAMLALAVGLAIPSPVAVGASLVLLGGEYGLYLVADRPPADARAASVAAALLACGELSFWSIELRTEAGREAGRPARRLGFELAVVLGGFALAAAVLAVADAGQVRGSGIELVGGAAAAALLGLAVLALRPARAGDGP